MCQCEPHKAVLWVDNAVPPLPGFRDHLEVQVAMCEGSLPHTAHGARSVLGNPLHLRPLHRESRHSSVQKTLRIHLTPERHTLNPKA
ncbi:unnamed protein product [Symbiodinium sp. CCMP2592]|nr:unnamed protein product [Symbiodinium sp. CCMP2592]